MGRKKTHLLPKAQKVLNALGENIKLARKRRRLTAAQVALRADISRATLWAMEKGSASASVGNYLQVLFVLGLEGDLARVAQEDELGRRLEDARLLTRGTKNKVPASR